MADGYLGTIITAAAAIAGAILYGVFRVVNRRGGHQDSKEASWVELSTENRNLRKELDGFRTEVNLRLDTLDIKVKAFGRVLDDVNRQAPTGWIPKLNPKDVEILQGAIPTDWITNS